MNTMQEILSFLDTHNIAYKLYQHPPLKTVEEGLAFKNKVNMPGSGIKNLFLKDDHNNFYLISAVFDTKIDLKAFGKSQNIKHLRFASPELLMQYLGVLPGSVTPLALINDLNQKVTMILDTKVVGQKYIQIHPLQNDATVVINSSELITFFKLLNRSYIVYNFETMQNQLT